MKRPRSLGVARNWVLGGALLHQTRRPLAADAEECGTSKFERLVATCTGVGRSILGLAVTSAHGLYTGGIGLDPAFSRLSAAWYDGTLR